MYARAFLISHFHGFIRTAVVRAPIVLSIEYDIATKRTSRRERFRPNSGESLRRRTFVRCLFVSMIRFDRRWGLFWKNEKNAFERKRLTVTLITTFSESDSLSPS